MNYLNDSKKPFERRVEIYEKAQLKPFIKWAGGKGN